MAVGDWETVRRARFDQGGGERRLAASRTVLTLTDTAPVAHTRVTRRPASPADVAFHQDKPVGGHQFGVGDVKVDAAGDASEHPPIRHRAVDDQRLGTAGAGIGHATRQVRNRPPYG